MMLAVDKFHQFILPNTVKVFAMCISEFVDALIVAILLGTIWVVLLSWWSLR